MQYIDSTAEILAFKVLNRSVDKNWVNWAMDMVEAGFESESLLVFAGESAPFNQFELNHLTDNVFKELDLVYDDKELVIKNYICYLINKSFNDNFEPYAVLNILKNVYIELDYETALQDFYLLYFAKDDLLTSDMRWYWDGATNDNIDTVIDEYFVNWRKDNCKS